MLSERLLRLYLALARPERDERGSTELSTTTILMAIAAVTAVTLGGMFSSALIAKAGEIVRTIIQ